MGMESQEELKKKKIEQSRKRYKRFYDKRKVAETEADIIARKEKQNLYYQTNKEKLKNRCKSHYRKHHTKIRTRNNFARQQRMQSDPIFLLSHKIGCTIRNGLRKEGFTKKSKAKEILGCNFIEFKIYLESKFENWMTWENRGLWNGTLNYGWDIDHIIPICSAKTEEDILKLNHYTNLQPLCSYINRSIKRNKILTNNL